MTGGDGDLPAELMSLLEGLDGEARAARIALVRELLDGGHPASDLLAAHAEDRLVLLPAIDVLRNDGNLSVAEVAAAHEVTPEALAAIRRAMGLPVDREAAVYGPSLQQLAGHLRDVRSAGMSMQTLISFNYVNGAAASSIAAAARDALRDLLSDIDPDGDERSRAARTAQLTQTMYPVLNDVVSYAVGEHLREIARREVTATLMNGGDDIVDVAIGFADLVGFTALGESVSAGQLGAVAARLEHLARESLSVGCELVKTLGDGVMVAARSVDAVVVAMTDLVAAVIADRDLPALRVGVAHGPALARAGDWYGSVVNRASRLAASAAPGQIVVDSAARELAHPTEHDWIELGAISVKGLRDPVTCWEVR